MLRSLYWELQGNGGSSPAYTDLYVVFSSKNPDKMGMKYTCN